MIFKKYIKTYKYFKFKRLSVQWWLLISMMFGMTACSTKIAYNNLDWIASWYIDDYVTLTNTQEKQLDNSVESLLLWHRTSELQNYVVQIKYIKIDLKNGIKPSTIKQYITSLKQFVDVMLLKAEPEIMQLAYSLSDKQVTEFLSEIEQQNINKIEKHNNSNEQERLTNRFERIEEQVTSFTGAITEPQKVLLSELNQSLLSAFYLRIQFRREWANLIASAYQVRGQANDDSDSQRLAFEQALRPALMDSNSIRSEAYLAVFEHNQTVWADFLSQLIASLNTKQLSSVQSKLDDTIADLEALY